MSEIPIETLRRFMKDLDPQVPLIYYFRESSRHATILGSVEQRLGGVGPGTERSEESGALREPDDPRYVALDDGEPVRGSDGSCIEVLGRRLLLAGAVDPTCQLFTGFQGSGKTTELHRLRARFTASAGEDQAHVVFIDAVDYLDRYTPPTISDLLRMLAYALDLEASAREGGRTPAYLSRLWTWLESDVELKELGLEAPGAKLMLEIRNNPSFRQKTEAILQLRFQKFAEEAYDVIGDAIIRLRRATGRPRILVIVDGLEKFTPPGGDDSARMEHSVEVLFTSHVEWLRLPCHVIYTFPLWLRFRTADLGGRYDSVQTLPMVKVRTRDGSAHPAGTKRLTDLVARRIELEPVFGTHPDRALLPLVEASGGYPKDLLRLVRDLIARARTFPVSAEHVERIIAILAEDYRMAVQLANLDVLAHIATSHTLPLGAASLRDCSWLFERWLLLTYRNGEEWYDLHPMVRRAPAVTEHLRRRQASTGNPEPGSPAQ